MSKLYQVCRSTPKVWRELPNGTHNDSVSEPGYFNYIHEFLTEHVDK
jgi:hypothetical protein